MDDFRVESTLPFGAIPDQPRGGSEGRKRKKRTKDGEEPFEDVIELSETEDEAGETYGPRKDD